MMPSRPGKELPTPKKLQLQYKSTSQDLAEAPRPNGFVDVSGVCHAQWSQFAELDPSCQASASSALIPRPRSSTSWTPKVATCCCRDASASASCCCVGAVMIVQDQGFFQLVLRAPTPLPLVYGICHHCSLNNAWIQPPALP